MTASRAAEAVKNGQIKSIDLVNELIDRIEGENPALNAIVTLDAEGAPRQAIAADEAVQRGAQIGPLHGVPITIKDCLENT